jgi:uncharacterized protein (DUF1778 family)
MYKFEELVSMRVSKQDKELLEEQARLKRMTLSSFIRSNIMRLIEQYDKEKHNKKN